jgi:hypothetical protein
MKCSPCVKRPQFTYVRFSLIEASSYRGVLWLLVMLMGTHDRRIDEDLMGQLTAVLLHVLPR